MLPLTESVGHRAGIFMEKYALKDGLDAMDSLNRTVIITYLSERCGRNIAVDSIH